MQQEKLNQLARALRELGHITKLKVFQHISANDEDVSVPTMIAISLDLPVAQVGYSCKRLHEVGVLTRKVSGRYVFYGIDDNFIELTKDLFG